MSINSTPKIIIEARGGVVQQVYADSPVHVNVLDWDSIEDESGTYEVEDLKADCLKLESESKKMKVVW